MKKSELKNIIKQIINQYDWNKTDRPIFAKTPPPITPEKQENKKFKIFRVILQFSLNPGDRNQNSRFSRTIEYEVSCLNKRQAKDTAHATAEGLGYLDDVNNFSISRDVKAYDTGKVSYKQYIKKLSDETN